MASASASCFGAMSAMEVEAPPGNTIGGVHRDSVFAFQQWFSIVNANGDIILKITKSIGNFFSPEVDFKVNLLMVAISRCTAIHCAFNIDLIS